MATVTVVLPDNAEGSHAALLISQMATKMGGRVVSEPMEEHMEQMAVPGNGAAGARANRPASLRAAPATPMAPRPPVGP